MEEKLEPYFNEEGIKQFTLISNEEFAQLIKSPNHQSAIKQVERLNEDSWVIRHYCIYNEYIIIDSSSSSNISITFENCYFQNNVYFDDVVFTKNISFKDCYFDGNVHFSNCKFQNLDIQECHFKKEVYFSSGEFKEIRFSQHDTKKLTISSSKFSRLIIGFYTGSYLLNKLVLINNNNENGSIEITGVNQINEIQIYGAIYGNLLLQDVKCKLFNLQNVTNHGDLKFVNLNSIEDLEHTSFNINNSNLNNTEFYRLDLKSFKEVNITDSNLLNCIFINSKWPKNISAYNKPNIGNDKRKNNNDSKTNEYNNQLRETYRQLKLVLGKQGDNIQEQIFYSKEMDLYKSQIKCKNPFKSEFWDKVILFFSSFFSNYGTNFGKALFWFLAMNLLIFLTLIYFFNLENLYFSLKEANWSAFNVAFKLFLNQLNPLHNFNKNLNSSALFLDFVGRIFSSYLLYHLIRTSRRFVR